MTIPLLGNPPPVQVGVGRPMLDLRGRIYGRLTVIGYSHVTPPKYGKAKQHWWTCLCKCGNEHLALGARLVNGNNTNCGCWRTPAKRHPRQVPPSSV